MLLRDYASVFVRRAHETDPYRSDYVRFDLSDVMAFEKQAAGAENREEGHAVVYFFPNRSRVSGGELPEIHTGDYLAVGKWGDGLTPGQDAWGACRRVVSVTKRKAGSGRMNHVVIEAK